MPLKIFFSVGEPSGDLHAANLMQSLRARWDGDLHFLGLGGPRMAAAGCRLLTDMTELAVMWFKQVFANLQRFRQLLREAEETMVRERPDAVVMIDYPGFNWWIARAAKRHGIPVFYYGVPQMWAWGGWRVAKMRRLVDHVLCKLPFEARWFQERGCQATYVGHPYFDELASRQLDASFIAQHQDATRPLIALLPGSRTQEVQNNLHWFLKAAEMVHRELPHVRFAIASFNERQAEYARKLAGKTSLPIEIASGRTPEWIHLADCCWACSGSVSLELLFHEKPSAILYWVPRLQYWLVRSLLIRVRYITLVNLLASNDPFRGPIRPYDPDEAGAEQVPFPEYPTYKDESERLAQHALEWLTDPVRLATKKKQLSELKQQFAHAGASQRAAEYLLASLGESTKAQPRAA